MRILLLGSTGMLGSAFAHTFKQHAVQFISVNHQMLDIESEDSVLALFDEHTADVVINCTGIVSINPCEEDPELCTRINALGALYISRQAAARKMTFVQFSSHAVFDGTKNDYYTEDDIPSPNSVYAVSKYASEIYASQCPQHYVIRVPVMFGPRNNSTQGFVDKMLSLMKKDTELRIADDKIDSPTYSMDVAKTVYGFLANNTEFGLYHIANSGCTSYYDFIVAVRDTLGIQATLHRAKDADFPSLAPKPLRTAMRSTKIPALRGWHEALSEYLSTITL